MKVLAVDDEPSALTILARAVEEAAPGAETRCFPGASAALASMNAGFAPDVAFLDVELPGMDGLALAVAIRERSETTNIVFVTGFSQYALEAFSLHPSGYVLKPVSRDKLLHELENLRHPIRWERGKRVRCQCFGNFEAFAGDAPLPFRYSKSRELLAYLVDRKGASADTGELCAILWEDRPLSAALRSQFRNCVADLSARLREAGAENVFIRARNRFSIDVSRIDCDYYEALGGNVAALNTYRGQYMSQYSWSEMTLGALERRMG